MQYFVNNLRFCVKVLLYTIALVNIYLQVELINLLKTQILKQFSSELRIWQIQHAYFFQ